MFPTCACVVETTKYNPKDPLFIMRVVLMYIRNFGWMRMRAWAKEHRRMNSYVWSKS